MRQQETLSTCLTITAAESRILCVFSNSMSAKQRSLCWLRKPTVKPRARLYLQNKVNRVFTAAFLQRLGGCGSRNTPKRHPHQTCTCTHAHTHIQTHTVSSCHRCHPGFHQHICKGCEGLRHRLPVSSLTRKAVNLLN